MDVPYIDEDFVRKRITSLRLLKGVSEREMSLTLGMCESYVRNITSTTSLPSMSSFLNICEYFNITPSEFFDERLHNPNHSKQVLLELERLFDGQLPELLQFLKKLDKSHADALMEVLRLR